MRLLLKNDWKFTLKYQLENLLVSEKILTPGNWYEGELTPIMYDPNTLQPTDSSYVVKCNDGHLRKIGANCFITQAEFRNNNLNELLNDD